MGFESVAKVIGEIGERERERRTCDQKLDIKIHSEMKLTSEDLTTELLNCLVAKQYNFQVVAVINMKHVVSMIEGMIEKKGYKCRVYSENRSATLAAAAIPTGLTQLAGIGSAIGMAVHNIATFNPDFEIGKNKFNGTVTVKYKK